MILVGASKGPSTPCYRTFGRFCTKIETTEQDDLDPQKEFRAFGVWRSQAPASSSTGAKKGSHPLEVLYFRPRSRWKLYTWGLREIYLPLFRDIFHVFRAQAFGFWVVGQPKLMCKVLVTASERTPNSLSSLMTA